MSTLRGVQLKSTIRVFTSTKRLANQLKINEITEVGELVTHLRTISSSASTTSLERGCKGSTRERAEVSA